VNETLAWDAWSGLTEAERTDVSRFAKLGRRHPDPRVAAAAEGWAQVVIEFAEVRGADGRTLLGVAGALAGLALSLVDNGNADLQWVRNRGDLRWARRVLAAQ
jgi:hypothetical protein